MNTETRLQACKQALDEIEKQLRAKEYAKAEGSAKYLHGMAGQLAHWIRMEHGTKHRPGRAA